MIDQKNQNLVVVIALPIIYLLPMFRDLVADPLGITLLHSDSFETVQSCILIHFGVGKMAFLDINCFVSNLGVYSDRLLLFDFGIFT